MKVNLILALFMAASCASQAGSDCGYRPNVRAAADIEARTILVSRIDRATVADLNDAEARTDLPDTVRVPTVEDRITAVEGTLARVTELSNGTFTILLSDHGFNVLAYVPARECSNGSLFRAQIEAVRSALRQRPLRQAGARATLYALIFYDHILPGGAKTGVALTPVIGLKLSNGVTYGVVPTAEQGQ